MSEDLEKRLRHLVSLNEPEKGGPYGGLAAELCMRAMREAADALAALRDKLAAVEGERDAPSDRLEIGSPEWLEDNKNALDHNHWSHGLIDPSPERQKELVQWAEHRLFKSGWAWAKDNAKSERRAEAAEARATAAEAREARLTEAFDIAINSLEGLHYVHDGNPSLALADIPELEYARHMLGEVRSEARRASKEARAALTKEPGE